MVRIFSLGTAKFSFYHIGTIFVIEVHNFLNNAKLHIVVNKG
jgi:hypothetical protein